MIRNLESYKSSGSKTSKCPKSSGEKKGEGTVVGRKGGSRVCVGGKKMVKHKIKHFVEQRGRKESQEN